MFKMNSKTQQKKIERRQKEEKKNLKGDFVGKVFFFLRMSEEELQYKEKVNV